MSYWEPCPTNVRLCLTYPHDGTPVTILQDGGLRISHAKSYQSSRRRGGAGAGPRTGPGTTGNARGFCPHFWGLGLRRGASACKTQNSQVAFAPHFWGVKICTRFFNFGPGGIAPGRAQRITLLLWLLPQLNTNYDDYILQLDGAPPHFHRNVWELLNRVLQQHWIGRAAKGDNHLPPWPPRSPDLTPCNFFLWWFVKDSVYVPPCPCPSRNFVIG